jgi:hypothetical protein
LRSVVVVESTREVGGKIEREMRLYFTSLVLLAHPPKQSLEKLGIGTT